jgi:hypothetical protein
MEVESEGMQLCRAAFENWAAKVNKDIVLALKRKPSGEYLMSGTSLAWQAFQQGFSVGYDLRHDEVLGAMA